MVQMIVIYLAVLAFFGSPSAYADSCKGLLDLKGAEAVSYSTQVDMLIEKLEAPNLNRPETLDNILLSCATEAINCNSAGLALATRVAGIKWTKSGKSTHWVDLFIEDIQQCIVGTDCLDIQYKFYNQILVFAGTQYSENVLRSLDSFMLGLTNIQSRKTCDLQCKSELLEIGAIITAFDWEAFKDNAIYLRELKQKIDHCSDYPLNKTKCDLKDLMQLKSKLSPLLFKAQIQGAIKDTDKAVVPGVPHSTVVARVDQDLGQEERVGQEPASEERALEVLYILLGRAPKGADLLESGHSFISLPEKTFQDETVSAADVNGWRKIGAWRDIVRVKANEVTIVKDMIARARYATGIGHNRYPDVLINGQIWDIYSPLSSTRVSTILKSIWNKVSPLEKNQTRRVIVNGLGLSEREMRFKAMELKAELKASSDFEELVEVLFLFNNRQNVFLHRVYP